MKRKKRIWQIKHVLVNYLHFWHHCSAAGTPPSLAVLSGEAFLHY